MKQLDGKLLFTVQAEGTAAVAQPTFVTDIDFSKILTSATPTPTNTASPTNSATPTPNVTATPTNNTQANCIGLHANQLNVADGAQFEVFVAINSGASKLKSYTVKIQFNSDILQAVDADSQTTGIQADFLDDTFSPTSNTILNTTGSIVLKADTTVPKLLDTDIVSLKFNTTAEGTANISIVQSESSLVDDSSANILQCTSALTIGVGTTNSNISEIQDQPLPPNSISSLPKSDLPFNGVLYVVFGIIMIGLGALGRKFAKEAKVKRSGN